MITGVEVRDFRGIKSGKLEGLTPLTILTGRNGSGKSSLLDALLFAASDDTFAATAAIVSRHPESRNGAQWVQRSGAASAMARAKVDTEEQPRIRSLRARPGTDVGVHGPEPHTRLVVGLRTDWNARASTLGRVTFAADNHHVQHVNEGADGDDFGYEASLIDPGQPKALHDAYSEAVKRGGKGRLLAVLRSLLGDQADLEVLTEGGEPALHLHGMGGVVPVSLSGDGLQSLIQTLVELSRQGHGVALIEEPEAFQHPSALVATARAIVEHVTRGLQVILTTHSQELIDQLLIHARSLALSPDAVSVATLDLQQGVLVANQQRGNALYEARNELDQDLR